MIKKSDDEATSKANASETTEGEPSSKQENLEAPKETKEEVKVESKEEITSDYLEEGKEEKKVDYKKRYGDSTREYQTLKTRTDRLNQAITNLETLAKANPKIVAEIEAAQGMASSDQNLPSSTLNIQQQIDKALEPVKKVAQGLQDKDRQSKVKVLAAFESKNPKFFSKLKGKEKKAIRQRIGKVANALVETGLDFKDAVNRAYLTVNPKAAIQKGKDKAYLEGLDEKQAGFSSQTSTEGKKPGKPKYTKKELEIGEKMGVKKAMLKDK